MGVVSQAHHRLLGGESAPLTVEHLPQAFRPPAGGPLLDRIGIVLAGRGLFADGMIGVGGDAVPGRDHADPADVRLDVAALARPIADQTVGHRAHPVGLDKLDRLLH